MDDLTPMPSYYAYSAGFFDDCIERWHQFVRASQGHLPEIWFDIPKRLRITDYWLGSASALACRTSGTTEARSIELVEAHAEAFYMSAFLLVAELRHLRSNLGLAVGKFDPQGVRRVRNELVVHQVNGVKLRPPLWSLSFGGDGDIRLKFAWRGDESEPDWRDPGLYANAAEFRLGFLKAVSIE